MCEAAQIGVGESAGPFGFGEDLLEQQCVDVHERGLEQVQGAILEIPEDAWVQALDQDGSARKNGEVAEITDMVDLSAWPG